MKRKIEEMEQSSKGQHEAVKKVITKMVEIVSEVHIRLSLTVVVE